MKGESTSELRKMKIQEKNISKEKKNLRVGKKNKANPCNGMPSPQ